MSSRLTPRSVNLHTENHYAKSLQQNSVDVVVIGSGPASRSLGALAAANGLSTVIAEAELVGGECPFRACVPPKALLRPAEALGTSRQVTGAKELIAADPTVDVPGVFAHRDKFTHTRNDDFSINLSISQSCTIVRGQGALVGEKKVVRNVNGEETTITANHTIVLATGFDPVIPYIAGISEVPYWTPREANYANEVPSHFTIIGAGAVGALGRENGSWSLGGLQSRRVCLYDRAAGFPPGAPPGFCKALRWEDGDGEYPFSGWLYAVGDTNGISRTTYMGEYRARIAANVIIARAKSGFEVDTRSWSPFAYIADDKTVAQVIFTDPNVAHTGLTVAEAENRGVKVETVKVSFQFSGAWLHAWFNYEGWAQWVIDTEKNVLAGANFVGREAADLVYMSTVAIVGEIPTHRLIHAVPSFPTVSEVYRSLYAALW